MGCRTCPLFKLLVKEVLLITTGAQATHKTQRQCGAERLRNYLFSLSAALQSLLRREIFCPVEKKRGGEGRTKISGCQGLREGENVLEQGRQEWGRLGVLWQF